MSFDAEKSLLFMQARRLLNKDLQRNLDSKVYNFIYQKVVTVFVKLLPS